MSKIIRITTVPVALNILLKHQMQFLSNNGFEVIMVSADGKELNDLIKQENCRHIIVPMTRTISPMRDLMCLVKLVKILRNEKPDIVHSHTPKAGIVGMLAAYFAGVPIRLHTVAGMPLLVAKGNKRRLLEMVEKLTYAFATKIYPNSYGLKSIITRLNFTKPKKLKVIGNGSSNGIDTMHFDPNLFTMEDRKNIRESLGINKDDFVFIFVGRVVGDKGINELVSAFYEIKNKNAKLLIVGPRESELDPLEDATIEIMSSDKRIIETGFQKDVRPYFAISDLLVFPSYREGFPNVVMQAAAMKLPAIVSDINGCNEIVSEGVNGSIVQVKSITDLLNKMKYFLCLPQEALKKMGEISRKEIDSKYKRELFWDALLKEYNCLLSNH